MINFLKIAAAVFVVFYLLSQPEGAARQVTRLADGLAVAVGSLARFVSGLG